MTRISFLLMAFFYLYGSESKEPVPDLSGSCVEIYGSKRRFRIFNNA